MLELSTYCVSPSAGSVVDFDLKKGGVLGKMFLGERRIAVGFAFILQKALKTVWSGTSAVPCLFVQDRGRVRWASLPGMPSEAFRRHFLFVVAWCAGCGGFPDGTADAAVPSVGFSPLLEVTVGGQVVVRA
ncbi:hypothetical protein HKO52_10040 [Neisseria meningitidis]|nr:hypothetical protein [Neisseria meningitidis]